MTFNLQQPFTQGYGPVAGKNTFGILGNVRNLQNTAHMRFAGDVIGQIAKNEEQKYRLKAMKLGMQPKQSQGGTDWLGLAKTGIGLIGGLGGFGGGGSGSGGISFADGMNLGLPSFGDYSGIPSGGWGIPFG